MEIQIAIPTHRREQLVGRTIQQIPKDWQQNITLFLSDDEDGKRYADVKANKIVTAAVNLRQKLNFIEDYYDIGTKVFQCEDDVIFVQPDKNRKNREKLVKVQETILRGFEKQPLGLFGFGSVSNAFFMPKTDQEGFFSIPGYAFGYTATKNPNLKVTIDYKMDAERSCKYFLEYGKLLRLANTGILTKNYITAGGLQEKTKYEERKAAEVRCCDELIRRYPNLVRYNHNRTSPMPEILLRIKTNGQK